MSHAPPTHRDLSKHRVLLSQTKMALVEPKGCMLALFAYGAACSLSCCRLSVHRLPAFRTCHMQVPMPT